MENSNAVKTSKIKVAVGLAFILFGILALIDIGYIIQSIVMGLVFLFGLVTYWFIFPIMILTGLYLIINRNKTLKIKYNPIIIGLSLLIFSLLILFTAVPYGDGLHVNNFNQLFINNYIKAIPVSRFTNYHRFNPLYAPLGGGWFGHLFAGLLSVITYAGTVVAGSLFLVIAVTIGGFDYIKKFVKFIKNKRLAKKSEKPIEEEANEPDIIEKAIESAPIERREETFSNDIIPDEEIKDPSILEKANLYSNNDAPEMTEVNEPTTMGGPLHAANVFDDDSSIMSDMPEVKKEEKILPPYQLPSFDLLKEYEVGDIIAKNEESCANNETIINATFQALRIGAKVIGHTIGPRITRYDVQVDANASIQAIPRYVSDISQRLGGVQARFEPIVAGKVTSGLEVPNKEAATIGFKEIVSVLPKGEQHRLMIPFGKNITGEIKYADLSKFPHLLIGGATGSGKSVFVHSIIMSLIMRNTPSEVRLLLVDPKRVEFTHYKNSPFLLCPVVTDPKKAKVALEKVVEEMERRYTLFESTMTNNIASYNARIKEKNGEQLPYIVTIVDEFADLIQQNKKIDLDIARITAKARAAGIHLVIATQRPSVDVITGVIKSNLPVRVALSVPDIESSKTIIGGMGAEQLLGNGDMLVSCPQIQASGCVRVQGCYVTDEEVDKVVDFINSQREPNYDPRFMDLDDHSADNANGGASEKMSAADAKKLRDEELYQFVKEQVYKREYTSISTIERENGIGFTRAGRLFKRLQDEGLVALESEASKGSKVLKENFKFEKREAKIDSEELTTTKPNSEN